MKRLLGLVVGVLFCGLIVTYGVTQETPVGSISGRLVMKENGKPLAGEDVTISPLFGDDDTMRSRGVETDENGNFSFRGVATGTYNIQATTKSHKTHEESITVDESKKLVVDLKAEPDDPYLRLYCSQKVFTSDEKPKIELHGFLPGSTKVEMGLYRVSLAQIEKAGSLQKILSPISQEDPSDLKKLEGSCEHVRDLEHSVKKVDSEGAFIDSVDVGTLETGVYFIACTSGKEQAGTALYVSDLGLVTKTSGSKMLCYTTHLKTGEVVEGAEISLLKDGKLQPVGRTNHEGLLDVTVPKTKDYHALVVAQTKTSVAFIGYRDGEVDNEKLRIVGYCERPAYRPGDEVNFKGIIREKSEDGYRLPKAGPVKIPVSYTHLTLPTICSV